MRFVIYLVGLIILAGMVAGMVWAVWALWGTSRPLTTPDATPTTPDVTPTTTTETPPVDEGEILEAPLVIYAWMGKDDTRVTHNRKKGSDVYLYRYRNEDCDITDLDNCTFGAVNNLAVPEILDTALTLTTPAYYEVTAGGQRRQQRVTLLPFDSRYHHTSVVHNGKIWMIGGRVGETGTPETPSDSVMSSLDGVTWTEVVAVGDKFTARYGHTSMVHDGKMWVIGGASTNHSSSYKNDVWSSPDGVTWTQVVALGPTFPIRTRHSSVVYDGKIWVIGGSVVFDPPYTDLTQ